VSRIKFDLQNNPSKFLLIRTDRIGDVILSTPVATALNQHFPKMEIHFLVRKYTLPIVNDHIHVHKSWIEEDYITLKTKIKFLKENQFTGAIFLHPESIWALAAFMARIPIRIGTGYRGYSFLFNQKIFEHRKHGNRHEVDLNMDLLRPLQIENPTKTFDFTIPIDVENFIENLLISKNINAPFIAIHPGSGGSALDWPLTRFAELADHIVEKLRIPVIFTGAENESSLIDRIFQQTAQPHLRLDGKLYLKQLAALLKKSELVISNSTGPLHLSVAVGTKVVGLYCTDRTCHPKRWGPYGQNNSVITPPLEKCEHCDKTKCDHFNCMELISVEQVFTKVKYTISGVFEVK